jgi:hypothetical protein
MFEFESLRFSRNTLIFLLVLLVILSWSKRIENKYVMFSDWVSFLAYPNLFRIKGFVVVDVFWKQMVKLIKIMKLNCSFCFNVAEKKLEQEIKERDEKYVELDTKLQRLHKRAKQRIQEVQKVYNCLWTMPVLVQTASLVTTHNHWNSISLLLANTNIYIFFFSCLLHFLVVFGLSRNCA